MKLYTTQGAPNPRRVAWILAEKGVTDIETINVNLFAGEHRTAEYRSTFGVSHVPALVLDDGTSLTESLAIGRYIESLYPEPNLYGVDAREQAVIEMWSRRCELYLANPMMLKIRFTHPALAALEAPRPEVGDYNLEVAEKFMKSMNRHLADHAFLADRFSVADIVALTGIEFGRMIKYSPPAEYENLARWMKDCKARPAAAAGL